MKGYRELLLASFCSIPPSVLTHYVFLNFPDLNIVSAVFWSFLGTVLVTSLFLLPQKQQRQHLRQQLRINRNILLKISAITSIGAMLWFYAIENTTPGITSFVGKSDIIFAFILGICFLKEKISKQEVIGLLIALTGFLLFSKLDGEVSLPVLGVLFSVGFIYSFQSFLVKKYAKNLHAISFTFLRTLFLTIFIGAIGLVTQKISMIPFEAVWILVIGQIFGVFLHRVFYFEAHNHLDISKITTFSLLNPVLVLVASAIFIGEPVSSIKLIGGLLILSGLSLFLREKFRLKKAKKQS